MHQKKISINKNKGKIHASKDSTLLDYSTNPLEATRAIRKIRVKTAELFAVNTEKRSITGGASESASPQAAQCDSDARTLLEILFATWSLNALARMEKVRNLPRLALPIYTAEQ